MIGANILLTIVVGSVLSLLIWKLPPPAWTAVPIAGMCLMLLGFVLWTIARFQLGKSLTVTAQAKKLITSGLYSKFRNPIYLFASAVVAGAILAIDRPLWLLIFVVFIPFQIWRGRKEADVLEASFGDEYRRYRDTTWL
jgi:protein-S-isoprenylcysteine O-methyltransferase Ste14